MMKNLISLALLIISVSLSFKHGWDIFNIKNNPGSVKMMNELGINESFIPIFGVLAIAIGILLLIPRTFFLGNMLNAISILLIMILALRSGHYRMTMIEIPFLAMPLLMIWLRYPFKN
ncbi:hypothetical protein [Chryseobacterium wanjuense]